MKYCQKCGVELNDDATYCPFCGTTSQPAAFTSYQYGYSTKPTEPVVEGSSVGWVILSLVIPLVGFILGGVWRKTKPKTSRNILIASVIGMIINIILYYMQS